MAAESPTSPPLAPGAWWLFPRPSSLFTPWTMATEIPKATPDGCGRFLSSQVVNTFCLSATLRVCDYLSVVFLAAVFWRKASCPEVRTNSLFILKMKASKGQGFFFLIPLSVCSEWKVFWNKTFKVFPFTVHLGRDFTDGTDTLKCCLVWNLLSAALEEQRVWHMERSKQPWEGMASNRDRNVNYRTDPCLKIFLVGVVSISGVPHTGYRMEAAYGAIEGRCDAW